MMMANMKNLITTKIMHMIQLHDNKCMIITTKQDKPYDAHMLNIMETNYMINHDMNMCMINT